MASAGRRNRKLQQQQQQQRPSSLLRISESDSGAQTSTETVSNNYNEGNNIIDTSTTTDIPEQLPSTSTVETPIKPLKHVQPTVDTSKEVNKPETLELSRAESAKEESETSTLKVEHLPDKGRPLQEPLEEKSEGERLKDKTAQVQPAKEPLEFKEKPLVSKVQPSEEPLIANVCEEYVVAQPLISKAHPPEEPLTSNVQPCEDPLISKVQPPEEVLGSTGQPSKEPLTFKVESSEQPLTSKVQSPEEVLRSTGQPSKEPLTYKVESSEQPLITKVQPSEEPLITKVRPSEEPLEPKVPPSKEHSEEKEFGEVEKEPKKLAMKSPNDNKADQILAKSDSGFSEKTTSDEDEYLEEQPLRQEINVEEAHRQFEKRYGCQLLPNVPLVQDRKVSTTRQPPLKKQVDHVFEDTDNDEDDNVEGDDDDDDESSIHSKDGVRLREEQRRRDQRSYSSRRSSTDSSEEGFNLNIRDLKNELKDVEEKFRKAMVANAGLDNEKSALTYQVELLKDQLEECEEQSALVSKELREKNRDLELLKRSHAETQRAVQLLQMQLDEQARLVAERGMVMVGNEEDNEDNNATMASSSSNVTEDEQEKRTRAIVSSETAAILGGLGKGPLDVRIKRLAEERDDLQDTVRRLKLDLEEERNRNQRLERAPYSPEEAEWETKRLIDDYKFKLQKSEQDINTLQTNVARLESQVIRFKTAAETAERSEEELKTERRKLQREARDASTRIDELETANKHLETRLGKLKTAKSNLLKEL